MKLTQAIKTKRIALLSKSQTLTLRLAEVKPEYISGLISTAGILPAVGEVFQHNGVAYAVVTKKQITPKFLRITLRKVIRSKPA